MSRDSFVEGCVHWALPVAFWALLTGMFWIGDRSLYHKLYYGAVVFPTLLCLVIGPARFASLWREPLLVIYSLFAIYVMIALFWSPESDEYSKLKHPLYILFLFLAVGVMAQANMHRLVRCVAFAAVCAIGFALLTLSTYWLNDYWPGRLSGMGALYNPLLTSHVYGFFTALWLAALVVNRQWWGGKLFGVLLLLVLLFLTGSRTPFLALAICGAWLLLLNRSRRLLLTLLVIAGAVGIGMALVSPAMLARGFSYRPAIWFDAWRQIEPVLWFGHGYDADMTVMVAGLAAPLADPHNLTLGVMYQTGLVGAAFWLSLYGYCLLQAWRLRAHGLVVISSTLLVYGFAAGMTEGSAFMSRPKEHWFLVWIPIALHFAVLLWCREKTHQVICSIGTESGPDRKVRAGCPALRRAQG